MKKPAFISFLLLFIFFGSNPVFSQNQNKPLQNEILSRGAIEIGELEFEFSPGWWQYHPSCDGKKWISFSQVFEPRTDYRASCDQQIHDFETVVVPTLSKSQKYPVPAAGTIIVFWDVTQYNDDKHEKEPWFSSVHLEKKGTETNLSQSMVGGNKKLLETGHYAQAQIGDRVLLKIDARQRGGSGKIFYFPFKAKITAYLVPPEGQSFPPEVITAAKTHSIKSALPDVKPAKNHDEPLGYIRAIIGEGGIYRLKDAKDPIGMKLKKGDKLYVGDILQTDDAYVKAILDSYEDKPLVIIKGFTRLKLIKRKTEKGGILAFFGKLFFKGFGRDHEGPVIMTSNAIAGCSDSGPGSDSGIGFRRSLPELADTMFDVDYNPDEKTTRISLYEGKLKIECTQDPASPIYMTEKKQMVIKNNCDFGMSQLTASNDTPQKAGWSLTDEPDNPSNEHSGILNPTADSHVYAYSYSGWNRANWGKYEFLGAGWNPTGGEKRAFLRFDVSEVDRESFNRAVLRLFHYHTAGTTSSELGVYTVRSAWNEGSGTYKPSNVASPGELCWINQPTIDPYPVAYFNPGSDPNKFIDVDITTLVKSWLNGMPNYGLTIKTNENYMGNSESVYGFYSREFKDADKWPQLIINDASVGTPKNYLTKKQPASGGNSQVHKVAPFEIPNKGGKYVWEHTKDIVIPGEGAIVFEAKTVADLTIGFAENTVDRNSMYEIVIGAFGNLKALIRKGAQTPPQGHAQIGADTNKMASVASNQWISYWTNVKNGLVKFGRGKTVGQNVILEWQDPDPLRNIEKVGFSSWNTPIKFRNVAIYNTANPVPTEDERDNWPEIDIDEPITIGKSGGTYSWDYLNDVKISGNTEFIFEAKATEDLTVCFAEERDNKSAMYEIVIGGWGNTRTVIRKFRQTPQFGLANVTVNENPDAMVKPGQWEKYWISVENGLVRIGKGNEIDRRVVLEWQDPDNPLEFISTIGLMCWNRPYEIRNLRISPID